VCPPFDVTHGGTASEAALPPLLFNQNHPLPPHFEEDMNDPVHIVKLTISVTKEQVDDLLSWISPFLFTLQFPIFHPLFLAVELFIRF
jgi:hypothetical protein